jgi:hypothetical protein
MVRGAEGLHAYRHTATLDRDAFRVRRGRAAGGLRALAGEGLLAASSIW